MVCPISCCYSLFNFLLNGVVRIHHCSQVSLWILLRMRNVSDTRSRENQNTHFVFSSFPPPPEIRAIYEIMWKNIVERGRQQMTIWRMRIACWIPKATNIHSEYVIIISFPRQRLLRERACMLRCSLRTWPVLWNDNIQLETSVPTQFFAP
jgi:hypothetical protein